MKNISMTTSKTSITLSRLTPMNNPKVPPLKTISFYIFYMKNANKLLKSIPIFAVKSNRDVLIDSDIDV